MERFAANGLTTMSPPIVAANAHSADPHYGPSEPHPTAIRRGDFVLLDLWAKEHDEHSIYADFTWIAFVGEMVPEEHAKIFSIVANARDAAAELVRQRVWPTNNRSADARPTAPPARLSRPQDMASIFSIAPAIRSGARFMAPARTLIRWKPKTIGC